MKKYFKIIGYVIYYSIAVAGAILAAGIIYCIIVK